MLALTEDRTKAWLREAGFAVPEGRIAASPEEAVEAARALGGEAVVKALVATGRRGRAGAVRLVTSPDAAAVAARDIIGSEVGGLACERVYVEERIAIADELYLACAIEEFPPKVLVSREGGVEIEETRKKNPGAVIVAEVDPLDGITPWQAVHLWRRAGVAGKALARLGALTAGLFRRFQEWDATTLEINPLALDAAGRPILVGAMMGIDDEALTRQARRLGDPGGWMFAGLNLTGRERSVREAHLTLKGGMVRFTELAGDIGLLLNGGGAGLYQHDLITSFGGAPANHSDMNGVNAEKIKALIRAVLENPNVRGLLVSANHLQMTRADAKVQPVIEVLQELGVDARIFPVVVRMFGPKEAEAREIAARMPAIHYMAPGATFRETCGRIVELTRAATETEAAQ